MSCEDFIIHSLINANVCIDNISVNNDLISLYLSTKLFQTIITDPTRKTVLNILPNRKKYNLDKYFTSLENKNKIEYVIMDMWRPYCNLARKHFKNAKIVIEKFHFVRQVIWAVENVRKRVQKSLSKEDRLFFKHSKKLLLTQREKLTVEELCNVFI